MMMLMEQKAAVILQQLERHGYEAYFVGGFVRDKLANRPIHDIDLATEATPEVVMSIFSRTVPTGLKHGTVTVLEQGTPFEVTTFRQEQDYEHHRRPRSVSFVSDLEQDLKRRDFTINAMAMNRHGQLIDPFGGQADLERQLLRCVGRAEERFHEDALRMLRCVRFAAEYELEIEHETWQALLDLRHLTSHVAMERVRAEMERILEGSHPERGLPLLVQSRLPSHYKVDLPVTNQQWAKAAEFGIQLRWLLDADLRWHHFLWLLGLNRATGRQFLRKLTFSNERLVRITDLLALTSLWMGQNMLDRQAIHTLWIESIVSFGPKNGVKWLHWLRALQNDTLFSQQTGLSEFAFKMLITNGESWMRAMAATNLKELRIDGRLLHDTYSAARGPRIGQLLNQLLHEVALGKTKNETEILLARADQLLQTIMMNERQVE